MPKTEVLNEIWHTQKKLTEPAEPNIIFYLIRLRSLWWNTYSWIQLVKTHVHKISLTSDVLLKTVFFNYPESKVHRANMGLICRQNLAVRVSIHFLYVKSNEILPEEHTAVGLAVTTDADTNTSLLLEDGTLGGGEFNHRFVSSFAHIHHWSMETGVGAQVAFIAIFHGFIHLF